MKIIRERPDHKRFHQVTAPMRVRLPSGETAMATNWSLGGLRLDGLAEALPQQGEMLQLSLELPFQGFDISFEVNAKVENTDSNEGMIGFEFEELSERAHDLMNHFIDDLVRGQMATVDDTICRIDVPVTPISTKPDIVPGQELAVGGWPIKTIAMSLLYCIVGVAIFGYLSILTYSKTMRLEVRTAVISAPLATLKMPIDGIIRPVRFAAGTQLKRGQRIASIENPKLLADIEEKHIQLDAAKRAQLRAQERYRIEAARMKLYQVINRTDRQIAEAKVNALTQALQATDATYERLSGLKEKGLVTASKFGLAIKERAQAEARLKEAELELERTTAMDNVSDRRYFNHKEFVADLDMLALEIEEASALVNTTLSQLEKLEKLNQSLAILSPYDGKIVSIQQAAHTTVLRNEPLLTIEEKTIPTVTAFVDQDQILKVGLRDVAKVYLPSLGQHIEATVTAIDRNSTFINSGRSHYAWKDGKEKSAAISLQLHASNLQEEQVSAGLPAVVIFPSRQVNDIYHMLGSLFSSDEEEVIKNASI
ncbi:MAG: HlyD family efflux transporter periplasmic adaptor subunit [Hyphomicrobiales bacterium]